MLRILDCSPLDHGGYPDQANTVLGSLITSWPGGRIDPIRGGYGTHGGIDLVPRQPYRRPLYAVVKGRLTQGWDLSGGGNWSRLDASNAPDVFGYGHADAYFIPSLNGQTVEAGTVIGYLGTTGASTGFHLHFAQRASAGQGWGDPYPALLRTQQADRYPGEAHPPVELPPTEPPTEFPPNTEITSKELYTMGCVFAVDSGPQVVMNTATQSLVHVPDDGRRKLLLYTLNAEKHPLSPLEYLHLDWNNPQHQAACDDYYQNWMPSLPPHLRHDDRPRDGQGNIIR